MNSTAEAPLTISSLPVRRGQRDTHQRVNNTGYDQHLDEARTERLDDAGKDARSSLILTHNIYVLGAAALVGHGQVNMLWIDITGQRPISAPDKVRVAIGFAPPVV